MIDQTLRPELSTAPMRRNRLRALAYGCANSVWAPLPSGPQRPQHRPWTYLTSAAGHRRHLAQGSASHLKDKLLLLHLPHFAWITEISTVDSYNQPSPGLRRIYGHTVLDATSTAEREDALLVLHLPGLLVRIAPQPQRAYPLHSENHDRPSASDSYHN